MKSHALPIDTPVLRELLSLYPALPPAERRVADFILASPGDVLTLTSSELARRTECGQPAVSRLCGRLSTAAFPAFKVRLAQEVGAAQVAADGNARPEVVSDPFLAEIVDRTGADLAVALRAVATLDPTIVRQAAQTLVAARWTVTCGFDLSGSVAWRLASLLRRAGCRARSERDPYTAPWADDLEIGDALVVVSYRGRIPQFFDAIRQARRRGATVLILTNEAQSELAALADILVLTRAPAAPTDDDYVTGLALWVQLAATRALWMAVVAARHSGKSPANSSGKGAAD